MSSLGSYCSLWRPACASFRIELCVIVRANENSICDSDITSLVSVYRMFLAYVCFEVLWIFRGTLNVDRRLPVLVGHF